MQGPKPKILILYFDKPTRVAISDLLYCYKKYAGADCFYYSMHRGALPEYLTKINFDLIVFHTIFISHRWLGFELFKKTVYPLIENVKRSNAVKILLPQDEWIHTDTLNDFVNEFEIDIVYSVAPESEFKKIYDKVNFDKVKFFKVLTGYIDDTTLSRIAQIESKGVDRKIDIGYRAFKAPPWLGSHGYLKTKIADVFNVEAKKYDLVTDISTNANDTFLGDSWYDFLLKCKYFIGVEGGATVLDPDGSIWRKGIDFEKENPNASFKDFESSCFPGMDGNLQLIAISPRHLEACSTKTCQVLIEGDYNGILKPDIHYIEVKRDFSNIKDVLDLIKSDKERKRIVDRTYSDIVASGNYSYKKFVDFILTNSLAGKQIGQASAVTTISAIRNGFGESASNFYHANSSKVFREKCNSKWRLFKYQFKSIPLTVLIRLGVVSLKEVRAKIKY